MNFTRIFFSKIEIGSDLADIGLKLTTKAAGSRIGVVERKAHKLKAKKNSGRWLLLPAALTLLLAGAAGWSLRGMSARELLAYAPENLWLAALMLIGCYPLKALSVFFPIAVLYLAAGLLFPLPAALLVTLAGSAAGYFPAVADRPNRRRGTCRPNGRSVSEAGTGPRCSRTAARCFFLICCGWWE